MLNRKIIFQAALFAVLMLLAACTESTSTQEEAGQTEQESAEGTEQTTSEEEITFPDTQLQKLDEGEAVSRLQTALNEVGYQLPVDGTYSEALTWAITDYQLQQENLEVTGVYNKTTGDALDETLQNGEQIDAGSGLPPQTEPVTTEAGSEVVGNPYEQLVLVNKSHALPQDYHPDDLVVPDVRFPFAEDHPKKQMRSFAASALEDLFQASNEAGLDLFAQSGFRSHGRQDSIFASNVSDHGLEAANNFSARPGESEHQTGLSMDVTSPDVGYQLVEEFGETDEGQWLKENAHEFGFIIRYPEGKEDITNYQYEPWHLRYVGEKAATEIASQGITLEEYLSTGE